MRRIAPFVIPCKNDKYVSNEQGIGETYLASKWWRWYFSLLFLLDLVASHISYMVFIVLVNGFIFIGCVSNVKEEDEDEERDEKEEVDEEAGANNEEGSGEEEEPSVQKRKRRKRKLVVYFFLSFSQFCVCLYLMVIKLMFWETNSALYRIRPAKSEEKPKKKGGGFTKVCSLSPELQAFTGTSQLARTEVT